MILSLLYTACTVLIVTVNARKYSPVAQIPEYHKVVPVLDSECTATAGGWGDWGMGSVKEEFLKSTIVWDCPSRSNDLVWTRSFLYCFITL